MPENSELSSRQRMILQAVVDLHISEGEPIGSKFLIEKRNIPFSSATVRNEMASLEAMGYLTHPHTSAGRIPSAKGYRFYVDSLMEDYDLTQNELEKLSELVRGKAEKLDDILERAARLAGTLTNYSSMALRSSNRGGVISKYRVVMIDERNILLVMILEDGNVKTKQVRLSAPASETTIENLESVLNTHLTNVTPDMINLPLLEKMERDMGDDAGLISPISKIIYSEMNDFAQQELQFDGVSRLLQYPEFSDLSRFGTLLNVIENKNDIIDLVSASNDDDVRVYIGAENADSLFHASTLIFKTIKQGGRVVGAIGVLGPRRMDYSKVITTVKLLSGEIEKMQGNGKNNNLLTNGGDKE